MTQELVGTPRPDGEQPPRFPAERDLRCPFDPPAVLTDMLATNPIGRVQLWDGSTPWMVTKHDDVRCLLGDERVSADARHPGFPHRSAAHRSRLQQAPSFMSTDDPEHRRIREMITSVFAIRKVEATRPRVQAITDDLIDKLLDGPKRADLVAEFALPLPSLVISELLGVPTWDQAFFQKASANAVNPKSTPEEAEESTRVLVDYIESLLLEKLHAPSDDVLSRLATEQIGTGAITSRKAADLGFMLLVAGHETTSNQIALGTLALLLHPEQFGQLRDSQDPKLVARAVEELLRYLTITHGGRRRVAIEDIEIRGQLIHSGEGIICANNAANRDSEIFSNPNDLDLNRDARRHLAFGYGVHQCLGQPLARVELQVVYGTLYKRIPTLRLAAELEDLSFRHDAVTFGVVQLPVTW
jgi:cytochrome P450